MCPVLCCLASQEERAQADDAMMVNFSFLWQMPFKLGGNRLPLRPHSGLAPLHGVPNEDRLSGKQAQPRALGWVPLLLLPPFPFPHPRIPGGPAPGHLVTTVTYDHGPHSSDLKMAVPRPQDPALYGS